MSAPRGLREVLPRTQRAAETGGRRQQRKTGWGCGSNEEVWSWLDLMPDPVSSGTSRHRKRKRRLRACQRKSSVTIHPPTAEEAQEERQ
ncbi:hypothetical protein NDU88_005838 [Pleurodeles waltl]|uniref:Uncharacterized protein n=1 Tax=Pleurodeles waltl TaxID=8319 RepID=A0AAV7LV70_PLEWA|nr:hypothetical protein NDU88_005838 [Pleurodeles waltl]